MKISTMLIATIVVAATTAGWLLYRSAVVVPRRLARAQARSAERQKLLADKLRLEYHVAAD